MSGATPLLPLHMCRATAAVTFTILTFRRQPRGRGPCRARSRNARTIIQAYRLRHAESGVHIRKANLNT